MWDSMMKEYVGLHRSTQYVERHGDAQKEESSSPKRRQFIKWGGIGFAVLLLVICGSATAYSLSFSDKALPGVTLGEQSLSGKTRAEVTEIIEDSFSSAQVTFTVNDQDYSASLEELGVSVDVEETVERVFSYNDSFFHRLVGLFRGHQKQAVYELDQEILIQVVEEISADQGMDATDASVQVNTEGTAFEAVAAVDGQGLNSGEAVELVSAAATSLSSQSAQISVVEVTHLVTTADAQSVADQANQLIDAEVSIIGYDESVTAEPSDKVAWIRIDHNDDGTLAAPMVDQEAITEWVQQAADATDVEAVNGIQNVSAAGEVLATPQEGSTGYTANNVQEIVQAVVSALENSQDYAGEFSYDEVEPTYTQRQVDDGAENLEYAAAPGEKWIDINLTDLTVTAYEGASVVYGPVSVVGGAEGTETVTGQYAIYLKYEVQTMRGTNLDGSTYVSEDVPWVSYFYLGYALHGATSRSVFGWEGYYSEGGSHGCVNMPVDAAKWIYDWGEIGTIVVSHY